MALDDDTSTICRRLLISPSDTSQVSGTSLSAVGANSDAVTILAALLCTLICLVGLGFMVRCAWQCRFLRNAASRGGNSEPATINRGLKKKAIRALPVAPFGESAGKSTECAICLADFLAGEPVRVLPRCAHCFHPSCIDTWLSAHSSCPSCRLLLFIRKRPPATSPAALPAESSRRCERRGLVGNSSIPSDGGSGNEPGTGVPVVREEHGGKLGEDDPIAQC